MPPSNSIVITEQQIAIQTNKIAQKLGEVVKIKTKEEKYLDLLKETITKHPYFKLRHIKPDLTYIKYKTYVQSQFKLERIYFKLSDEHKEAEESLRLERIYPLELKDSYLKS